MDMTFSRFASVIAARHILILPASRFGSVAPTVPRAGAVLPAAASRLGRCHSRFAPNAESCLGRIRKCLMGLAMRQTVRGLAVHPLSNARSVFVYNLTWYWLSKMDGVRGRVAT